MGTLDVLLLGASGSTGRLIADELARRGLSIGLAGRDSEGLNALAQRLSAHDAQSEVCTVDVTDPVLLRGSIAHARVVVSTVGPFTPTAGAVVEACLALGVSYVDIANEWSAVR